ncbi:MAG: hypothetical protein NPIRA03_39010 [Nitrospirales bacterium]|nr:MAG: hypothetical protein NPIRA03_39010 [Nitrospirales bacterium]
MNMQGNWKLVLASTMMVLIVGCAFSPPSKMVKQNNHAQLADWYQKEARDLHARAEEMRHIEKEYEFLGTPKEGHESSLVEHAKNLKDHYTKAAKVAEAMAKVHAEQAKNM